MCLHMVRYEWWAFLTRWGQMWVLGVSFWQDEVRCKSWEGHSDLSVRYKRWRRPPWRLGLQPTWKRVGSVELPMTRRIEIAPLWDSIWWWSRSSDPDEMIQTWWRSRSSDDPVVMMIQIKWSRCDDDPDLMTIQIEWWSNSNEPVVMMMQIPWWRRIEEEDDLKTRILRRLKD